MGVALRIQVSNAHYNIFWNGVVSLQTLPEYISEIARERSRVSDGFIADISFIWIVPRNKNNWNKNAITKK